MWGKRAALAIALLTALAGVGHLLAENVIDYVVRIILLCGINAILAVGLNLINGTNGQFSIGHAGFMAVGAYSTAFTVTSIEDAWFASGAAMGSFEAAAVFATGIVVGAACAGLSGVLVGVPSLRLRGDYLAIVTLGFGEIIRLVFNNAQFLGAATGYSGDRALGLSSHTTFFWVFAWATLVITLIGNLTYSSYGRALSAIRDDEVAAEAMGIPTTRFKVLAFAIGSAAAGVAGGLFAHLQSTIRPDDFKFDRSIDILVMVILGGLGSVTGAVVGAVFVAVSLELMRDLQQYRLVIYALILILTMIFRPSGLLAHRELPLVRLLSKLAGPRKEAA